DKVAGLLGGRAAEDITFGEVSTGAHNDFERVTGIIRSMVTEYGMSDRIGQLQYTSKQGGGGNMFLGGESSAAFSDAISKEIDEEMQRMVKEQYARTKEILT